MDSTGAKSPGTTPGTAAAGMQEADGRWLGWVRIMLREPLTAELYAAVGVQNGVLMVGGRSGGSTESGLVMVSIAAQPSAEKAKEVLSAIVEAVVEQVGYAIVIETFADGE